MLPHGKGGFHQGISLPLLHTGPRANLRSFASCLTMPRPARSMAQVFSSSCAHLDIFLPFDHSHLTAPVCRPVISIFGSKEVAIVVFQRHATSTSNSQCQGMVDLPDFGHQRAHQPHSRSTWWWLPPVDRPSQVPRLSCLIKMLQEAIQGRWDRSLRGWTSGRSLSSAKGLIAS